MRTIVAVPQDTGTLLIEELDTGKIEVKVIDQKVVHYYFTLKDYAALGFMIKTLQEFKQKYDKDHSKDSDSSRKVSLELT